MPTKDDVTQVFPGMLTRFQADKAKGVDATIQFELSGDAGGTYWVKIAEGQPTWGEGAVDAPSMVFKSTDADFIALMTGKLNPMQAFMMGKIKVNNMDIGMKMMQMFQMG
jgi:putative sterol carrier protein